MHDLSVTTKTITLDLDAYEKLHAAQKPGESLSEVIRRTSFGAGQPRKTLTGAGLLEYIRRGGGGFTEEELDSIEEASKYNPPQGNPQV